MAKILAPFEYNIDIKNLWDIKTTSGSTKIWVHLKIIADMERTECVPKDDFGPAEAAGRSQTRPVEPLGIDLVYRYIDRHQNFCYSL